MTRRIWIRFNISEEEAGGLLADLAEKVTGLEFGVVEEIARPKKSKPRPMAAVRPKRITVPAKRKRIDLSEGIRAVKARVKLGGVEGVSHGLLLAAWERAGMELARFGVATSMLIRTKLARREGDTYYWINQPEA